MNRIFVLLGLLAATIAPRELRAVPVADFIDFSLRNAIAAAVPRGAD